MSSQADVHTIAMALPGATEEATGYQVGGKLFAWNRPERINPKKPRVPNPDVLCVRVADDGEKQELLASAKLLRELG